MFARSMTVQFSEREIFTLTQPFSLPPPHFLSTSPSPLPYPPFFSPILLWEREESVGNGKAVNVDPFFSVPVNKLVPATSLLWAL